MPPVDKLITHSCLALTLSILIPSLLLLLTTLIFLLDILLDHGPVDVNLALEAEAVQLHVEDSTAAEAGSGGKTRAVIGESW